MLKQCAYYFKGLILLYIIMGFAAQLLNSLGIVYFQKILDSIHLNPDVGELSKLIIVYGCMLAGICIINYLNEYPSVVLSNRFTERLKIMALHKISRVDYSAYQEIGTGEMIKVIENGAQAGKNIIFSFYLRILHELLPTMLFSLLFISFYDIRIMLVISLGYIVIFILTNLLLKFLYRIKASLLQEQENSSRYSIRGFMELVVFRTNRRYEKEIKRLEGIASNIVNKSARIKLIHESFFAIFALLIAIIKFVVLFFGVKSVIKGETSVGIIVALIMFIDKIFTPIAIFNVIYVDYKLNKLTFKRFEEFLGAPEDKNLEEGLQVTNITGQIELRNVSFRYGEVEFMNNVSLSIQPGTTVAFVGLSGGGKSTLVKLMIGLLKKRSGEILWDGTDVDKLALNSLYHHITYIPQEAPIFDTTIKGNIVFDDDRITEQELYDVLEVVHLKEKVLSLPERLDTRVGERGVKLSGGEKQRLAFARAMIQNRNVLILDEPVSALDNITETEIMDKLLEIYKYKTLIVIAHRLSFIRNIDKIVVVKDGSIVDEGVFEDLMARCTYFKELWDKQQAEHPTGLQAE